jgi:KAP family P-loop domain
MSDSPPPVVQIIKSDLQKIMSRILKEAWFQEARNREEFDVALVEDKVTSHIQELTEQDNLYALGAVLYDATHREDIRRIRSAPRGVRATLAFLAGSYICLTVISILQPWFYSEYGFVFVLPILISFPFIDDIESWWTRVSRRTARATKATTDVEKAMRSLIERSVREVTVLNFTDPAVDTLTLGEGIGLSSRADEADRIATRYRSAVEMHLLRPGGAAVGVTGERGTGKSELLRSFCHTTIGKADEKSGGTIQVFVAVPAAFQGIDFLALMAKELARAVPRYRSGEDIRAARRILIARAMIALAFVGILLAALVATKEYESLRLTPGDVGLAIFAISLTLLIASANVQQPEFLYTILHTPPVWGRAKIHRNAEELALRLKYAETIGSQSSGSLGWSGVSLTRSKQRNLSSLPLTETDLISEIKILADKLSIAGYRIVIGIDEMDKLEPGQATDEFLNTIKQLFAIKSCSYIVSVSSSAWAKFTRRGINLRDALDSSLDVIETVGAFDFKEIRSLILHRRVAMTNSQVLFCYVLSGGLPREALRFARSLAVRNRDEEGSGHKLAQVARLVLDGEVQRLVEASKLAAGDWPEIDCAIALRKCDYLYQSWRSHYQWWHNGPRVSTDAFSAFEWVTDDSFVWTGGRMSKASNSLRGEALDSFNRLELMIRFLMVVRELFSAEPGAGIAKYPDREVVAIGNKLAVIRRVMESDPLAADCALREMAGSLSTALQPGDQATRLKHAP